ITNAADDYGCRVHDALAAAGLRTTLDLRNEKIGYKVREHSVAKVPVIVVVGAKEAEAGTVALRRLSGDTQESVALAKVVTRLRHEAAGPLGHG
ncbi:MAG TPA: His/Gly/Thr/Pro-type tRNA ligase C-terminal domain-containing protein, partial [Rhodospirillales bacterium]|nr:His/Gly/Thr/Pro-type tRNA ligase C-terminal domain-containing protein [Rhodospirillales bacterium]